MSVILDALQKARGDRRKNQVEPHPNSVARVLEPAVSANPPESAPQKSGSWVLPVVIIMGMILLLAMAGGAFFLLYDQMRRLEPAAAAPTAPIVPPTPAAGAIAAPSLHAELSAPTGAAVGGAELPPPLPLTDLPVQPPSTAAHGGANSTYAPATTGANAAPNQAGSVAPAAVSAAAAPQFKLGSIVCENNICMVLINGRTLRQGEKIQGYVVAEINDKGVTLKSESGPDEIYLDLYN